MFPDNVIEILNRLTIKLLDSAAAFDAAGSEARSFEFYTVFEERASERKMAAKKFQSLLNSLEHKPPERGSLVGAIERAIGHLVHGRNRSELMMVELFDREEIHIITLFERLLNHPHLAADIEVAVEQEYKRVTHGFSAIKALERRLSRQ
jgi:uncharacterized protein (TIGR02284 family)